MISSFVQRIVQHGCARTVARGMETDAPGMMRLAGESGKRINGMNIRHFFETSQRPTMNGGYSPNIVKFRNCGFGNGLGREPTNQMPSRCFRTQSCIRKYHQPK
jgi:hypothetical protein